MWLIDCFCLLRWSIAVADSPIAVAVSPTKAGVAESFTVVAASVERNTAVACAAVVILFEDSNLIFSFEIQTKFQQ